MAASNPWKCYLCDMKYTHKCSVTRHLKREHADEIGDDVDYGAIKNINHSEQPRQDADNGETVLERGEAAHEEDSSLTSEYGGEEETVRLSPFYISAKLDIPSGADNARADSFDTVGHVDDDDDDDDNRVQGFVGVYQPSGSVFESSDTDFSVLDPRQANASPYGFSVILVQGGQGPLVMRSKHDLQVAAAAKAQMKQKMEEIKELRLKMMMKKKATADDDGQARLASSVVEGRSGSLSSNIGVGDLGVISREVDAVDDAVDDDGSQRAEPDVAEVGKTEKVVEAMSKKTTSKRGNNEAGEAADTAIDSTRGATTVKKPAGIEMSPPKHGRKRGGVSGRGLRPSETSTSDGRPLRRSTRRKLVNGSYINSSPIEKSSTGLKLHDDREGDYTSRLRSGRAAEGGRKRRLSE